MLLTAATAAAGTIMVLALALGWLSEHSAGRLPSSLAGRWPGGSASEILYISNLTKEAPFNAYVPARRARYRRTGPSTAGADAIRGSPESRCGPEAWFRCRIRLHNLGPRTLANVDVRVDTALLGKSVRLTAMATAADADPPTTTFSNSSSLPRVIRTVRQVPWSTESLTASRALEGRLPGNPLRAKVAMGELRPGPENARYFQFAFRIE